MNHPYVSLSEARVSALLEAAREGTSKCFLTKEGNTRYGAAALTSSGRLYSAGQYSSFNHITNVHAETAAVVTATMSRDPEIVALCLVSTAAQSAAPAPCGICRQILHEHAQRTGRDILVIMASWDGSIVNTLSLSELLPEAWKPRSLMTEDRPPPWGTLPPWRPGQTPLRFGDLVQTETRFLSMVWAPEWEPGIALLKMKYDVADQGAPGEPIRKIPHSFTQYGDYCKVLEVKAGGCQFPWGEPGYLVPHEKIQARLGRLPLASADLARQPIDCRRLDPLLQLLERAHIPVEDAYLTCSWIVGLAKPDSDFDIAVSAPAEEIRRLRSVLHRAFLEGTLSYPDASGTWRRLASVGRKPEDLASLGRFVETFCFEAQGRVTRCSLIYVRPEPEHIHFPHGPATFEITAAHGRVVEASEASYKPGTFVLEQEDGSTVEVQSWHKWAGLIKEGDLVSVRGAAFNSNGPLLVQVNPEEHFIRWSKWNDQT